MTNLKDGVDMATVCYTVIIQDYTANMKSQYMGIYTWVATQGHDVDSILTDPLEPFTTSAHLRKPLLQVGVSLVVTPTGEVCDILVLCGLIVLDY